MDQNIEPCFKFCVEVSMLHSSSNWITAVHLISAEVVGQDSHQRHLGSAVKLIASPVNICRLQSI